jgi:hypothetical protein
MRDIVVDITAHEQQIARIGVYPVRGATDDQGMLIGGMNFSQDGNGSRFKARDP